MQLTHTENIIEVNNLSFSYSSEAVLKNINLEIHKGDYLAIIGPNGGGKTTLLKCILGLLKPEKGDVKLFNQDLPGFKDWSYIGYVPQKVNFDLNFPASAREVTVMGIYGKKGLFRQPGKKDWEKADKALEQVGMQNLGSRRIGELSGGQVQRVFIARALVSQPSVIFLDEPTVGVDTQTRNQFFGLLKKLNEQLKLTLVLITHDMDIVLHHGATEAAFINREVLFYGKTAGLFKTGYIDEHFGRHI